MLTVLNPGFQTTVQDLGRFGLGDQGVSPAGAMDPLALRLGNLIVGNPPEAAALEMTLLGPTLRAETDLVVALAGAPYAATMGGHPLPVQNAPQRLHVPLPRWRAVRLRVGDVLTLGAAQAGARAYLCIAGGIETPVVMSSPATHLMAGLGGIDGRALQAGDRLAVGLPHRPLDQIVGRRLRRATWPEYPDEVTVRVVLGPQAERFTEDAVTDFLSQPYTVTPDSNRMGIRLSGPTLNHVEDADLLSEGIALGAIQVPQSGQPIILMVERQTTGGYTKLATVIGADIGRVGQARPGSRLRFQAVSVEAALALRRAQELLVDETTIERAETWGVDEVLTVMQAFEQSGLGELRLNAGGVRLVLRKDQPPSAASTARVEVETASQSAPERQTPTSAEQRAGGESIAITAPLLGVFYTAPDPEAPPFVQPGDTVEAGQVVGLIDVMKTLHGVTASQAGVVEAVLAENGALVEYGQPLITLRVTP